MKEIESVMGFGDEWAALWPVCNFGRLGRPRLSGSRIGPGVAHSSLGPIADSLFLSHYILDVYSCVHVCTGACVRVHICVII